MIVVSDTSPMANLAIIDRLDLLHAMYGTLELPAAVADEADAGSAHSGANRLRDLPWLNIHVVSDLPLARVLQAELDPGEAEALALAVHNRADLLPVDERKGRRVAARLGVPAWACSACSCWPNVSASSTRCALSLTSSSPTQGSG